MKCDNLIRVEGGLTKNLQYLVSGMIFPIGLAFCCPLVLVAGLTSLAFCCYEEICGVVSGVSCIKYLKFIAVGISGFYGNP